MQPQSLPIRDDNDSNNDLRTELLGTMDRMDHLHKILWGRYFIQEEILSYNFYKQAVLRTKQAETSLQSSFMRGLHNPGTNDYVDHWLRTLDEMDGVVSMLDFLRARNARANAQVQKE